MGIPRHKQTIALIINKVFNFISALLSLIEFVIVIFPKFVSGLIIQFSNPSLNLQLDQSKVKLFYKVATHPCKHKIALILISDLNLRIPTTPWNLNGIFLEPEQKV